MFKLFRVPGDLSNTLDDIDRSKDNERMRLQKRKYAVKAKKGMWLEQNKKYKRK